MLHVINQLGYTKGAQYWYYYAFIGPMMAKSIAYEHLLYGYLLNLAFRQHLFTQPMRIMFCDVLSRLGLEVDSCYE